MKATTQGHRCISTIQARPWLKDLKNASCLQNSFFSNSSLVSHKAKPKAKSVCYDKIWECNPRDAVMEEGKFGEGKLKQEVEKEKQGGATELTIALYQVQLMSPSHGTIIWVYKTWFLRICFWDHKGRIYPSNPAPFGQSMHVGALTPPHFQTVNGYQAIQAVFHNSAPTGSHYLEQDGVDMWVVLRLCLCEVDSCEFTAIAGGEQVFKSPRQIRLSGFMSMALSPKSYFSRGDFPTHLLLTLSNTCCSY